MGPERATLVKKSSWGHAHVTTKDKNIINFFVWVKHEQLKMDRHNILSGTTW